MDESIPLQQNEKQAVIVKGEANHAATKAPFSLKEIRMQILATMAISVASMTVGFSSAYTSPALVSMRSNDSRLHLTETQETWVGSLMPLSALVGSLIGGFLADGLGRKGVILACGPIVLAGYILIGAAVNVWMLYVARCMIGLCVGLLSLCNPLYIVETVEPGIRGTMGLMPTTIGNLGILGAYLLGAYVDWSTLAYIACSIPLLFFALMLLIPETPRLYVAKGKNEVARNALRRLRGPNTSSSQIDSELKDIVDNHNLSTSESSSIKDLFQKKYLKAFGLSLGLMMFQQLSGINAVVFYTVKIFEMSGSNINEYLSTIIMGIVNLLATLISNTFIDKCGRKVLLYISNILMIVSLFAISFYFYVIKEPSEFWDPVLPYINWVPLASLMLYVIGFSMGFGPIPWLFMAEALPVKIRGKAGSVVTASNWTCTFFITKYFYACLDVLGIDGTFLMFAIIMIISLAFVFFFIIETKGKKLEEIEAELLGNRIPTENYV